MLLRRVILNTKEQGIGVLGLNWEGPYRVREMLKLGVYELKNLDGKCVNNSWNAEHLRRYYV